MRLKSGMFVAALVRRVFADGGMAAVEKLGAEEAGAILVRVRHRDGTESLAAPAPQSVFSDARPDTRLFEFRLTATDENDVNELIAREARFDPDIWVVEIETDQPQIYIDIAES